MSSVLIYLQPIHSNSALLLLYFNINLSMTLSCVLFLNS